jgi:hypothetical protein
MLRRVGKPRPILSAGQTHYNWGFAERSFKNVWIGYSLRNGCHLDSRTCNGGPKARNLGSRTCNVREKNGRKLGAAKPRHLYLSKRCRGFAALPVALFLPRHGMSGYRDYGPSALRCLSDYRSGNVLCAPASVRQTSNYNAFALILPGRYPFFFHIFTYLCFQKISN